VEREAAAEGGEQKKEGGPEQEKGRRAPGEGVRA
jgi:hypothetical protein